MPRPPSLKPSYCFDKSSGRAFVTIDGLRRYLGRHGMQESRDAYDRVIGEWIAQGRPRSVTNRATEAAGESASNFVTVSQLIAAFWTHAKTIYPTPPFKDGKRPHGELGNYWDVLRPLRRLYGPTSAADFGPKAFKAVREEMVRLGWCRTHINRQICRVRCVFKWAVESELIPGEVYYRLSAVRGMRRGDPRARESDPVTPVADEHVDATLCLKAYEAQKHTPHLLVVQAARGILRQMRQLVKEPS